MKKKYGLFLFVLFSLAANVSGQNLTGDTIYFCREYKNGTEVGLTNTFGIGPGGDSITVMVRTKGPIKEKRVSIVVEKVESDGFVTSGTHKFDVEPKWNYIFFAGINFPSEGYYKVRLLREDGSEVASNYVTMVLINGRPK